MRKPMPRVGSYRYRGIALISVLWIIALLTVVAGALSFSVRSETKLAHNLVATTIARHAAEGGIYLAIDRLLYGTERERQVDRAVYSVSIGEADVRVTVVDEAGKIDLNAAPPELLDGLLRMANVEAWQRRELVDAIQDWRDTDDEVRLHGAEDPDYLAANKSYGAKDGDFATVDELQLVLGMSPQLFRKIRTALTVHSHQRGINPAAASRKVLLALPSARDDTIDAYVELRERRLANAEPLPEPPMIDRRFLAGGAGDTYTIHAEARMRDGVAAELAVTVQLRSSADAPFVILSWSGTQPSDSRERGHRSQADT
jgi:general secretion pathway protein K